MYVNFPEVNLQPQYLQNSSIKVSGKLLTLFELQDLENGEMQKVQTWRKCILGFFPRFSQQVI